MPKLNVDLTGRGIVTIDVPDEVAEKLEKDLTYRELRDLNLEDYVDWNDVANTLDWEIDPY